MDLRDSLAFGAPITSAREHGDLAEQLYQSGKWEEALEHHQQAAAQYKECLNYTHNSGLHTTLRMLHNDHTRAARDLKRRISEEEKHPSSSNPMKGRVLPAVPDVIGNKGIQQGSMPPERSARGRDVYRRTPQNPPYTDEPVIAPRTQQPQSSQDATPRESASSSPSNSRLMHDSQTTDRTVDGSYMFLGNGLGPQDSFTVFFKAIEGMLDRFSQPIAFATAPLVSSPSKSSNSPSKLKVVVHPDSIDPDTEPHDNSEESDSSFYMIESTSSGQGSSASGSQFQYPPPLFRSSTGKSGTLRLKEGQHEGKKSSHSLQTENGELKSQVADLTGRVSELEDMLRAREGQQRAMRDSIMMVKREAQRAMAASVNLGRSVLSPSPQALQAPLMAPANPSYLPIPSIPRPRQAPPDQIVPPITPAVPILDPALDMQTLKRMQDLETQIQTLKHENEQQKAQITRYRERWSKLKENAKRKQQKGDSNPDGVKSLSSPPYNIPEGDEV